MASEGRAAKKAKLERRKSYLWREQKGQCCYCQKPMMHWNEFDSRQGKAKKMPPTLATLEHLRDRFHPGRAVPPRGAKRWALACWQCNFERGKESQAAQPIETLRERAQNGHVSTFKQATYFALVGQQDGLFGDVCEELIEKSDGSAFWRRVEYPKGLRIVHTDKREGE